MSSSGLALSKLTRESFQSISEKINNEASAILQLTLQLEQVENHYSSIEKFIDESSKKFRSMEKDIKQRLAEIKLREEKLSLEENASKRRCEELGHREKELELMTQKELDRIRGSREELELAKLGFEEGLGKLDLQEKKLSMMAQERFEHEAKLVKMKMEFQAKQKRFKELVKEYGFNGEFEETGSFSIDVDKPETPCTKSKMLKQCSLIQNLTEKNHRLQAIKYVCEFNMADKFSPATLLQDHLRYVKKTAMEYKQKDDLVPTQYVATVKEIADLKALIQCIQLYKLEADFPLGKLQRSIKDLEKKKAELEKFGPCTMSKCKILHQPKEEISNAISTTAEKTQFQNQKCRNKRARIDVSSC